MYVYVYDIHAGDTLKYRNSRIEFPSWKLIPHASIAHNEH